MKDYSCRQRDLVTTFLALIQMACLMKLPTAELWGITIDIKVLKDDTKEVKVEGKGMNKTYIWVGN